MILQSALALLLSTVPVGSPGLLVAEDSLGWSYGQTALFHGYGNACEVDGEWLLDSSGFEGRSLLFLRRGSMGMEALLAASYEDSMRVMLREALAEARWPGTPWIGARAFYGREAPFVPGLADPILDLGFLEPDSLRGIAINAGGILGFEVEGTLARADSSRELRELVIDAPWLGFGTFRYERMELGGYTDAPDLRLLTAMADLRHVRPYFIYVEEASEDGAWGVMAELRGLRVLRRRDWDLYLIPGFVHSTDSIRTIGDSPFSAAPTRGSVSLDLMSRRYFISGSIGGWMDIDDSDMFGLDASFDMLSEAGIRYSGRAYWEEPGSCYAASIGARYIRNGAEAGGSLGIYPDSTRLTVGAGYSPRADASVQAEIAADLEGDMDPSGTIVASVWSGRVTARLGYTWLDGESSVFLGGTGWF